MAKKLYAGNLDSRERAELAQKLRLFAKRFPEIEDTTGYSQGYYLHLIDNFVQYGMPTDVVGQRNFRDLIFAYLG
jgi:hypothetical protein